MGPGPLVTVRFGAHRLELELALGVHHDPRNEALYAALATYVAGALGPPRTAPCRALDLGCGSGVLGLVAARAAGLHMTFADVHAPSVAAALANARRNGVRGAVGVTGDLLEPVRGQAFDLVLFNPPQTGGPPTLAHTQPDRYGGDDGAAWFVRLARELGPSVLPVGGLVIGLQHSRANPARVAAAWSAAGFERRELARQPREFTLAELDALAPGTGPHQLALRARGAAEFTGPDGQGRCEMTQSLWVATRTAAPVAPHGASSP